MSTTTSPTAKRKVKTAADLRDVIARTKARLAAAEAKEYSGAVESMIKKLNIPSSFNTIKANIQGSNDLLILEMIGKAVGIKRLVITQSEPKPRKKKTTA